MTTSTISQTQSVCLATASLGRHTMPPQVAYTWQYHIRYVCMPFGIAGVCITKDRTAVNAERLHAGLYQAGDWLMFGAETTGLPKEVSSCLLIFCFLTSITFLIPFSQDNIRNAHIRQRPTGMLPHVVHAHDDICCRHMQLLAKQVEPWSRSQCLRHMSDH